jgi:hypothetical protein
MCVCAPHCRVVSQPWGSDTVSFYGSTTENALLRPTIKLTVRGPMEVGPQDDTGGSDTDSTSASGSAGSDATGNGDSSGSQGSGGSDAQGGSSASTTGGGDDGGQGQEEEEEGAASASRDPPPFSPRGTVLLATPSTLVVTCDSGGAMTEGFVKGLLYGSVARGQFPGEDARYEAGMHGIRVGDGYHDYLLAGFVSCNHS